MAPTSDSKPKAQYGLVPVLAVVGISSLLLCGVIVFFIAQSLRDISTISTQTLQSNLPEIQDRQRMARDVARLGRLGEVIFRAPSTRKRQEMRLPVKMLVQGLRVETSPVKEHLQAIESNINQIAVHREEQEMLLEGSKDVFWEIDQILGGVLSTPAISDVLPSKVLGDLYQLRVGLTPLLGVKSLLELELLHAELEPHVVRAQLDALQQEEAAKVKGRLLRVLDLVTEAFDNQRLLIKDENNTQNLWEATRELVDSVAAHFSMDAAGIAGKRFSSIDREVEKTKYISVVGMAAMLAVGLFLVFLARREIIHPIMRATRGIKLVSRKHDTIKLPQPRLKELADITVSVEHLGLLMKELARAKEEADTASNAKSEFLANVSHEIRTPMNAIIGLSTLALRLESQPQMRNYLKKINNSSRSLLAILNEILDFSKIEAGKLELVNASLDVDAALGKVGGLFGAKTAEKGIELVLSISPGVPMLLSGDQMRLEQVLINLVSNAVKFTEQGEITVRVEPRLQLGDAVTLEFTITDTGVGIPAEQLASMFESFTQADSTTTRRYGGTGLGLAICKQLVKLMDGDISVQSEQGKGAKFSFTARFGQVQQSGDPLDLPGIYQDKNIIVISENASVRHTLADYLANLGCHTHLSPSMEKALVALKHGGEHRSDLVFMEWSSDMEDVSASVSKLRSHEVYAPLIFLCSPLDHDKAIEKYRAGLCDAVLVKPVVLSSISRSILEALGQASSMGTGDGYRTVEYEAMDNIRGARVLMAEDNEINMEVAIGMLEDAEIMVDTAFNGREAVEKVLENEYDGVLMDVQMPEMDGLEATRIIRQDERFKSLPIIAMTAHTMTGDRDKCMAAGMNDFVTKPIESLALFSTLARWITAEQRTLEFSETVEFTATTSMPTPEEEYTIALPETLPGFDLAAGVKRVKGRPNVFVRLVRNFARQHAFTKDDIRTRKDEGAWDEIGAIAHAVRGVAGNISALELHRAAVALERAAKAGDEVDVVEIDERMSDFTEALDIVMASAGVLEELEIACKAGESDECDDPDLQGEQEFSNEETKPVLSKLSALLEDADPESLEMLPLVKKYLKGRNVGAKFKELEDAANGYDFVKAHAILGNIQQKLNYI